MSDPEHKTTRARARTLLKASLRRLGATRPVWTAARLAVEEPGVIVLMYHRVGTEGVFEGVEVDRFRRQLRWLRRNCTVIAPEDLPAKLERPDRLRPPVLLTFDDGYRGYHDHAFPVLRELDLPAVVFLSTSFMDEGGALWSDALRWVMLRTPRPHLHLPWPPHERHDLTALRGRRRAFLVALRHLKGVRDPERKRLLGALYRELGEDERGPHLERQMMTWDEVRATQPLTRLGGHTHTHPILARADLAVQEEEIRTCRARIEDMCGVSPRWFAYPNGQAADFTAETRQIVARRGFDLAFSAVEGVNGAQADRLALRRFSGRGEFPHLAWFGRPEDASA